MILLDLVLGSRASVSLVILEALVVTVLGATILGFLAGREGLSGLPGVVVVYPFIFISVFYYVSQLRQRWTEGRGGGDQ